MQFQSNVRHRTLRQKGLRSFQVGVQNRKKIPKDFRIFFQKVKKGKNISFKDKKLYQSEI